LPADSEHSGTFFQWLQGTRWRDSAALSTGIPTPGLAAISSVTGLRRRFRDWPAPHLAKATVADGSPAIQLEAWAGQRSPSRFGHV